MCGLWVLAKHYGRMSGEDEVKLDLFTMVTGEDEMHRFGPVSDLGENLVVGQKGVPCLIQLVQQG